MNVSPDTLLRLVRNTPEDARPTPRCLGIDDVALRTGQRYGTLLVDLEAHQPVDLIEDHSAEVVAQWLQDQPGVDVITRDRSIDDAEGSSRGAPDALQVADRFHLLQNVREMLQRLLDGQQDALVAATRPESPPSDPPPVLLAEQVVAPAAAAPGDTKPPADTAEASSPPNQAVHQSQERRDRLQARYTEVRELHAQGVGIRAIAARLQLSRTTVRCFVAASQFPERATKRPQPSKLDPFIPHLEAQLAAGKDNGTQLWRELREQHGYRGSRVLVSRWVAQYSHVVPQPEPHRLPRRGRDRPPALAPRPKLPAQRRLSVSQAAWLLVYRPETLGRSMGGGIYMLRKALEQSAVVGYRPDLVILDLAPARGPVLATALAAAIRCVAPVQAADLVLQSLGDLVESIAQAREFNPRLRGLSVLRNNYAPRASLDHAYDQALAEVYADELLETVIPSRALIRLASGAQQSIFQFHGPDEVFVRNTFLLLAEELLNLDGVPA